MGQIKTLQFPNTPSGQARKVRELEQETANGWRIVSESIIPGKFKGANACCLFLIFAPCAFLAGHSDDIINVTLEKDAEPSLERSKWHALLTYDAAISKAAEKVRPFGQKWMDEFASAYMSLNDNKYLPEIVDRIVARANTENEESKARALEAEIARRERIELYAQWYRVIWGTNQRKAITIAICAALAGLMLFGIVGRNRQIEELSEVKKHSASYDIEDKNTNSSVGSIVIAPSFHCEKGQSEVLQLICSTPNLAQLDNELAKAYASAMTRTSTPKQLRREQRVWIAQRNNIRADVSALITMYGERISLLKDVKKEDPLSGVDIHSKSSSETEKTALLNSSVVASAKELRGSPKVLDTATLLLNGHQIALRGIVGLTGAFAGQFSDWIASAGGNSITCIQMSQGPTYSCYTDTQKMDLADAALLNGAAKTNAEATDKQRDIENQARLARRGVWSEQVQ